MGFFTILSRIFTFKKKGKFQHFALPPIQEIKHTISCEAVKSKKENDESTMFWLFAAGWL